MTEGTAFNTASYAVFHDPASFRSAKALTASSRLQVKVDAKTDASHGPYNPAQVDAKTDASQGPCNPVSTQV